jgi:hypothetical protein
MDQLEDLDLAARSVRAEYIYVDLPVLADTTALRTLVAVAVDVCVLVSRS